MSESAQPPYNEHTPGERVEPEGCPTFKKEDVETLCGMGISRPMAEQALLVTGCQSLEAAAAWYFESQDIKDEVESRVFKAIHEAGQIPLPTEDDKLHLTSLTQAETKIATVSQGEDEAVHMVFVVNTELKMGRGKIAAQVAHACLALYRTLIQNQEIHGQQLLQWETLGETNVVLSGCNAAHLADLYRRSTIMSLPCHLTQDAGKTQVPSGSCTVLSIFGPASRVDQVTGTLCLL